MQDGRKYSEWECLEQLSHVIGVKPLKIFVETHGTEKGSLTDDGKNRLEDRVTFQTRSHGPFFFLRRKI